MNIGTIVDKVTAITTAWLQYINDTVNGLADADDIAEGDAHLAVRHPATGGGERTQHEKNQDYTTAQDFGGVGDGVADDSDAIEAALAAAVLYRKPLYVNGRFRHTRQITVPARAVLIGSGWTSDSAAGGRSLSCFIKDYDGLGFLFSGDDAASHGIQYDSASGRTGGGIQVTGSRFIGTNGAVTNAGGDGFRVGATQAGASSINANCGSLINWQILNCGGWGLNFDHTNTSTSGTFPLGAPDCNAWYVAHILLGASGQPNASGGLKVGNSIDNVFHNMVVQDNTGRAAQFSSGARGHRVTMYAEGNAAGGPIFDSGAKLNDLILTSTLITGNDPVDSDGTNRITRSLSAIGATFFNRLDVGDLGAGASTAINLYSDVNADNVVKIKGQVSATSGGKLTIQTKADGGVVADRIVVDREAIAYFSGLANGVSFGGKTNADTTTPGANFQNGVGRLDIVNSGASSTPVLGFYNANGQVGSVSTSGTATAYATSSDYRLKRDISPADGAASLAAVMSWPIRAFVWRSSGEPDIGAIAHELQAIKPSAVTGEKDADDMQGVDFSKLIPELVAAVQFLAGRVAELESMTTP